MKKMPIQQLRKNLLDWYDQYGRNLPWRAKQPHEPNPYHVWLSEMMLQQTTVVTVIPYFRHFLKKWPTLSNLAQATQDAILVAWQGLGYYARARNLHKCAQIIMQEYGGNLPRTPEELSQLPGIGPYMSAAIASIAFDKPVVPVDGNVIRVLSRLYALKKIYPASKAEVNAFAETFGDVDRPGDFAQALMDLGAMICTPKNPQCSKCPWVQHCAAFKEGCPELYPMKEEKKKIPTRYAIAYLIANSDQQLLIRKRKESGLLAGLYEVPTTEWLLDKTSVAETDLVYQGHVKHTFTHFHLKVDVYLSHREKTDDELWVHINDLNQYALPTLMKKVISVGRESIMRDVQNLQRL
jgi:A/G-specific adenine glycosylase